MKTLSEADRRRLVESRLLFVVSGFGGEVIMAGPAMDHMVRRLACAAQELAERGFFTTGPES